MNFWILTLLLATATARPHIGTITIKVTPLFDTAVAARGGFYRAADRLQIATSESTVRKFLLFHEGDELDEARLRETERNLRQLDFLRAVTVTTSAEHDDAVDVVVTTEDAITTDFNADFSNDGGRSLYDVDVTQKNLFNRGGEVGLRFANGLYRRTSSLEVIDPEMFGPYWTADALGALSSDGNEERLSLERPLYSYTTPYTAFASFDHLRQDSRTYRQGVIDSVFRQAHREAIVQGGRVIRARPAVMTRVLAGADLVDDSFGSILGDTPNGRHYRFLELGIDRTRFNFISLDHVDFGVRKQDFNLGAHAAMFFGASPAAHGHGVVGRIRSEGSYGRELGARSYLISRATATTRVHDLNRNSIVSGDSRWILKLPVNHPQTFVAHARLDVGWQLDRDVQFLVDGQNGLRAYPNFAFEGSRRLVFNAEHRLFLGREVLDLFEPGAAVFVDSGEAVNGPLRPRALRTDFGIGLRCAIARLDSAMLRFDLAYALNNSPSARRGLQFSFATVQAF